MSFLKKLGTIATTTLQIAGVYTPLIKATAPGAANAIDKGVGELELAASVITQAEVFGQALSLDGKQKLTAAAPAMSQMILQSSLMAGKKIKDEEKFKKATAGIASNMADLLDSLEAA